MCVLLRRQNFLWVNSPQEGDLISGINKDLFQKMPKVALPRQRTRGGLLQQHLEAHTNHRSPEALMTYSSDDVGGHFS